MCYRCKVCEAVVGHGTPLRVHRLYRSVPRKEKPQDMLPHDLSERIDYGIRTEIAAEIPVCGKCEKRLLEGVSLTTLASMHRRWREREVEQARKSVRVY